MSTAKRAVAARIAERRAARADRWRGRHRPEGPEAELPVIRPAPGELRQIVGWVRRRYWAALVVMASTLRALALQIVRWVRQHYWAVQAVLVVMALTLTALGLAGLRGFWSP